MKRRRYWISAVDLDRVMKHRVKGGQISAANAHRVNGTFAKKTPTAEAPAPAVDTSTPGAQHKEHEHGRHNG